MAPVLHNYYYPDSNGYENCQRSCHPHWDEEGEQRYCNQCFPKPECGTNHCRNKNDKNDEKKCGVNGRVSAYASRLLPPGLGTTAGLRIGTIAPVLPGAACWNRVNISLLIYST